MRDIALALLVTFALVAWPTGATAQVNLQERASHVLVFRSGRWLAVRDVHVNIDSVEYVDKAGKLLRTQRRLVDVDATERINNAIATAAKQCQETGKFTTPALGFTQMLVFDRMMAYLHGLCRKLVPKPTPTPHLSSRVERALRRNQPAKSRVRIVIVGTPQPVPKYSSGTPDVLMVGAGGTIKAHCEKEWGTDWQMRQYCLKTQREAAARMHDRYPTTMSPEDFAGIRSRCAGEWPDDYQMRDYCEQQQVAAYASVHSP